MEWVDVYDAQRRRTGKIIDRNAAVEPGEWLLVVHACLMDEAGRMLIQQRQYSKDRYPGCWDVSAGGFVRSGEEPKEAVLREIEEELGLHVSPEALHFVLTEPFSYVLDDFFVVQIPGKGESLPLQLQEEEVICAGWANRETVLAMRRDGRFVDYDEQLLQRLFDR